MNAILRKFAIRVGCSFISIAIALAMIASWGYVSYGSAFALPAIIQGYHFIPDTTVVDVGKLQSGSRQLAEIDLLSLSSQPISIIGMRSNCTCVQAETFPFELPAGTRKKFRVWIRPLVNQAGTKFSQTIELYVGTTGPSVSVTVEGMVSKQSVVQ